MNELRPTSEFPVSVSRSNSAQRLAFIDKAPSGCDDELEATLPPPNLNAAPARGATPPPPASQDVTALPPDGPTLALQMRAVPGYALALAKVAAGLAEAVEQGMEILLRDTCRFGFVPGAKRRLQHARAEAVAAALDKLTIAAAEANTICDAVRAALPARSNIDLEVQLGTDFNNVLYTSGTYMRALDRHRSLCERFRECSWKSSIALTDHVFYPAVNCTIEY